MQGMKSGSLALLAVLSVIGACSGDTGAVGPQGPTGPAGADGATGPAGTNGQNGQDLTATAVPESCSVCHATAGSDHQKLFNQFTDGLNPATSQLKATIVSVVTSAGTNAGSFKSTVTVRLTKNGQPYSGAPTSLRQKTMYFVSYDGAGKFPTAPYKQDAASDPTGTLGGQDATSPVNFSYGSMTLLDAATGTYTMVKDNLSADPSDPAVNANAFLYGYFGDVALPIAVKQGTHYTLMDNIASVSFPINGTVAYTSTANASGCEKCHPAPYSKHGYRQAKVAGLNDFVACKACHTDFRRGTDGAWYLLVDDRAAYAAQQCLGAETADCMTPAQLTTYAYTANVMQDTHNSHSMEFEYPQSMANCATCHAGKLDLVLTDANFTLTTCKSCHPVTGKGGTDANRAPALKSILPTTVSAHTGDLYNYTGVPCANCHKDPAQGGIAPRFSQIHTGYNNIIYADNAGAKYSASVKTQVDSATFDSATNKLTVKFSLTGAAANAVVKPTVVVSLYGYDSKDFLVSGHSSQSDGTTNMEWTEGAVQRSDPTKSSNSSRLTVAPAAAAAGVTSWTATADLTLWASKLTDKSVKRAEVGILPSLGLDQTKVVQGDATKANYNPMIAISGVTRTFDLAGNALLPAVANDKGIVNPDKCNNCHDALGTTFHGPNYGSAGVVACRLCHTVQTGGSHLEMQSRSIDSYVHAIHTFQAFDIGTYDFSKPVDSLNYALVIEATYPQFSTMSCESCHNANMYDVPDQAKSMPGLHSASATLKNKDRAIGSVPIYVTGPGSRACGGCHRAELINEDAAGGLASFNQHAAAGGYMLPATSSNQASVLDAAIKKIMSLFQ